MNDWLIISFVAVLGLTLGSFVNALEWRLRRARHKSGIDTVEGESVSGGPLAVLLDCLRGVFEEALHWLTSPYRALQSILALRQAKPDKYSIATGRSMCPRCKHELAGRDLVPLLSWLVQRGKCRYCRKPISRQYPLIEALTALAFVGSYLAWPQPVQGIQVVLFGLWLLMLTGFVALGLYDAKWRNLPNELLYPLLWLALLILGVQVGQAGWPVLLSAAAGVLVIWGLFFAIYCVGEVTDRTLIGYGDVRLAVLLGLLSGGVLPALGILFLGSFGGSILSIGLLATGRATRQTHIPYGPFLLAAGAVVFLYGSRAVDWLTRLLVVA